jgi:hypothetical protein
MVEGGAVNQVLLSYAYHRDLRKAKAGVKWLRECGVKRILLDCGAFSAHTLGHKITLLDYERAICAIEPDYYVQLDVLGDPRRTYQNLGKMHRDGFDPIPIFTRPTPLSELDHLIKEGYPWIALGNLNDSGRVKSLNGLRVYMNQVFAMAEDRTRLHMFGIARVKVLLQFPFYSCDTSEALKATGYGVVRRIRSDGGSVASVMPHRNKEELMMVPHLSDIYTDGHKVKSGNRMARLLHNADNLNRMERHITKTWKLRGIEWTDPEPATYPLENLVFAR